MANTLADTNRLQWKGLMYEGDSTQMYYVKSRWYDPRVGRFISEDPIGIQGGLNLYAFGSNDPVNFIDRLGLDPSCSDRVEDLSKRVARLRRRVSQYLAAVPSGTNDVDHYEQIQGEIKGFNNDLDAYHRAGCDDDDDDDFTNLKAEGVSLENTPLPTPAMRYGPPNQWDTSIWNLNPWPTSSSSSPSWLSNVKPPTPEQVNAIGATGSLLLFGVLLLAF